MLICVSEIFYFLFELFNEINVILVMNEIYKTTTTVLNKPVCLI